MIKYKKIKHNITALLPNVTELFKKDPAVVSAYCFGSYGKGKPHSLSDVDIAVFLVPEIKDIFEKKLELQESLSKILLTDEIDIVILNDAVISLAMEVLRSGRLLVSRDEERRFDFEARIMKEYLDNSWLRELSERTLINRIKEGKYGFAGVG